MIRRILILGASYGSLFGTKLLMAVHDVTLVCRPATADLINARGTEVRLAIKGEAALCGDRDAQLAAPGVSNLGNLHWVLRPVPRRVWYFDCV